MLPGAVLGIEAVGATLLPFASLFASLGNFLLLCALLLDRAIGLPLVESLVVIVLLLLSDLLRALILLLLGVLLGVLVLLLLDLLPVLILLLLLGVLLGVLVLLLLLDLWPVLILLLLLGVLLGVLVLLLLLDLLPVLILLLLLGVLLGGRFLLLLLAPLLRGLGLSIRLILLVAFLFLLCVPERGGSETYCQNRCADNIKSFHRYFLAYSLNA